MCYEVARSGRPPELFGRAVGVRAGQDGGPGNGQSGDMSEGIEVGGAVAVADPKALLPGSFKTGIISFTFRSSL